MELNHSLSFSDSLFFLYILASVSFVAIWKRFLQNSFSYSWALAAVSTVNILFLYPKPIQLLGLITYLYLCLFALRKWYHSNKIAFPMLILAVPIILMKSSITITLEGASDTGLAFKNIIQIAGLSYMVFKVIGLYIDERRNESSISFFSFYNFVAFAPTLLIGPIDRFRRFENDVKTASKSFGWKSLKIGWSNFILGLLYKFIIAEAIYRLVLTQIDVGNILLDHWISMYAYLLYLFFDFAGYSLLAIAFGSFLGISVPINFDKPFLALNPKEFWRKWHKSLGDWLGDYFFKPIFKDLTSKKLFNSIQRQNIALFLTFTLMGFWNGFELHFIASGVLFSIYSATHNYYAYLCKKKKKDVFFGSLKAKYVRLISIFIMFHSVAFAIYIFSGKLF